MEIPDSVKKLYYAFEDKYYAILDKINAAGVPVYKAIDPIDQILPSFILVIISVLLLGVLLLVGVMSAVGVGLGGTATFVVEDENGDPLPDILVELSLDDKEEIKTTDAFGEFQTSFFGDSITVKVDENDFEKYDEEFNIQAGGSYTIRLESKSSSLVTKIIRFQIRDEDRKLLNNSINVSMEFGCSGNATTPNSLSRPGGSQQVTTQTNCGTLTTTINATGFKEKNKSINVGTHEGILLINLQKDELFGTIRVLVKDSDTSEEIGRVTLNVKKDGVPFISGGTTDSTGAKVISRVPVGTYIIEAIPRSDSGYINGLSSAFNLTANDARSSRPVEVAIFLRKTDQAKKILLEFKDEETGDPIEGVEAQIVSDNIYTLQLFSNNAGLVEYVNADEDANYSVVASHDDYLVKVVDDLPVVDASSNEKLTITLEKITEPEEPVQNFGTAKIIVTDFAGNPVPNASTRLNAVGIEFPIGIGLTGSDGITEFINLPVEFENITNAEYNAHAEKTIGGTLYEDDSENEEIMVGETTEFLLSLVISEGGLEVEVIDDSTEEPVVGAIVTFIDDITGNELESKTTDSDGETEEVLFEANKVPYMHITATGFEDFTTVPYQLVANDTQQILVRLIREAEFNSFDIELVDIIKENGVSTLKINDNETYTFKFNLLLAQESNDVQVVIRTGLGTNINSADSTIVVRNADSVGSEVLSDCYDQTNNYADCRPDDVTIDAKQVIIDMGDLNTGVYEIFVTTFVNEVPDNDEDDTIIEVHFGAKTEIGGTTIYRQSETELYLWTQNINERFCFNNDCGAEFALSIQDQDQVLINPAIELETGEMLNEPLWKDVTYILEFKTFNLSSETFLNVELAIGNDPPVLAIPSAPILIGRFAPGANIPGSFTFDTLTDTASTSLELDLELGLEGDAVNVLFGVSAFDEMNISMSPTALGPNQSSQIIAIQVLDGGSNPVEGVDITVTEQVTSTSIGNGGPTDDSGIFRMTFTESYVPGVNFDITAEKTGYVTTTSTLTVSGLELLSLAVDLDFLVANEDNDLTFTVTDNLDQPVSGATVTILDLKNERAQIGNVLTTDNSGIVTALSNNYLDAEATGDQRNAAFEVVASKAGFGNMDVQLDVLEDLEVILDCITISGGTPGYTNVEIDDADFTIAADGAIETFTIRNNNCGESEPIQIQITALNDEALIIHLNGASDPYEFREFVELGDDGNTIDVMVTSTDEVGNHPLFIFGYVGTDVPETAKYPFPACLKSTEGTITCEERQDNCLAGEFGVVSLSKETNATVGPYEGIDSYPTKVCCELGGSEDHCYIGLTFTRSITDPGFIDISSPTNAHASTTGGYGWSVYCPAVTNNACAGGTTVLNLSKQSNAHVSLENTNSEFNGVFAGTAQVEVFDTSACFGGGSAGSTGEGAVPRLLFDWNPDHIDENACSVTNWVDGEDIENYAVCDSAQLMMSLVARLNLVNDTTDTDEADDLMAPFDVYLMKDALSTDFISDFGVYLTGFFTANNDWVKYFEDTDNLTILSDTTHPPGIYTVTMTYDQPDFTFFDDVFEPAGIITIELSGPTELEEENLFYYLPFDGKVGQLFGGGIHRDGYGVGFTGDEGVPIFHDSDYGATTDNLVGDGIPIAMITVQELETFEEVHVENAGKVFSISEIIADNYLMTYAPSVPNPVIIKAEGNGESISANYIIAEGGSLDTGDWITRLREIVYKNTSGAFVCIDESNADLPLPNTYITDRQATIFADDDRCATPNIGIDNFTYGFNRETSDLSSIFFETIFYTPKGNVVTISNECQSQGRFYVGNLTNDGDVSTDTPFTIVGPGQTHQFNDPQFLLENSSIADLVLTVGDEDSCITEGETAGGRPTSVALWWNDAVLLKDLRDAVAASGIEVDACIPDV